MYINILLRRNVYIFSPTGPSPKRLWCIGHLPALDAKPCKVNWWLYRYQVTMFFFWSNVRFDWEWFGPPGMSWSNANPSFLFHFCQCSCHKAEGFTGFPGPSSTFAGLESDLAGDNGQQILYHFFIMCASLIKNYQWCLWMSAAAVVLAGNRYALGADAGRSQGFQFI